MNVRRILTACVAGVITLSLLAGFAAATESRTVKPDTVLVRPVGALGGVVSTNERVTVLLAGPSRPAASRAVT